VSEARPATPVATEAPAPDVGAPPPTRRFTDAVPPCATRLGKLQIRGTLTGSDSVELGGTFDGPITVEGMCHVHESGRVTGEVIAGDAVIAGAVEGRLTVTGRLEMWSRARVHADVEAATIAIAEGCFIEGRIHMRGSESGSQPTAFKEKRKGRRKGGSHGRARSGPRPPNPSEPPSEGS
jgi:cytoskeletal protein CcmA (bactofilin family)